MNQKLFKLLDEIENNTSPSENKHSRVLLIDALNLFFRNFSMLNMVNPNGSHIGGLGGFLRSLGYLIKEIQPTSVYIIFDGVGSTINRKNILPEYKSGRNIHRITNWEVFDNLEEEDDSKIDQISRLIQYLKLIPVKTISIDRSEADDIIAYLSKYLEKKHNSSVFIVSNDRDFLQLITNKITVYRPTEREYYNPERIKEKFNILHSNFLLYKTLLGDSADKIEGIKGLGEKGILKRFPELSNQKLILEDLFQISEKKLKEHIIYARIIQDENKLKNNYKIMDLSNPFIGDDEINQLNNIVESKVPDLHAVEFVNLYNEDNLGAIIRNIDIWLKDNFTILTSYK